MSQARQTILVTGGSGMTGHAIIHALLESWPGVRVRATHHRQAPDWRHPDVEWVKVDLLSREGCRLAVEGVDMAVFCAASTGGAAAAGQAPERQMTDNIVMDTLLLEGAQAAGVRRVVYLSSATVYQEFEGFIAEDQLDLNAEPHGSYLGVGWAKRAAEKFCRFWSIKHGMEFAVFRCANIYGPRASFDPARSNFVPALIRKAVARLDPFEVWGSPDVRRDIVFVEDVGRAVLAGLRDRAPFEVYNLGSHSTIQVQEVVGLALDAAGHKPSRVVWRQDRPTTIAFRGLDCQKAREKLGWWASTDPRTGIGIATSWWTQNQHHWNR